MNPSAIFLIIPLLAIAFVIGFIVGDHSKKRRRKIGYYMEKSPNGHTVFKPIFEDDDE